MSLDATLAENVDIDNNRIVEIAHSEHSKIDLDVEAKKRFEIIKLQGSSIILDKVPKPLNRLNLNYTDDTTAGAI
ncbi:hypothetical protein ABTH37_19035, partial [Acinetobacter baumannii]